MLGGVAFKKNNFAKIKKSIQQKLLVTIGTKLSILMIIPISTKLDSVQFHYFNLGKTFISSKTDSFQLGRNFHFDENSNSNINLIPSI